MNRRTRLVALLAGAALAVSGAAPAVAPAAGPTKRAVDISQFNGCSVNYTKVRRAGYDTLIFRVAFVGNDGLQKDACFNGHQVYLARRAGLRLGGYIYDIPRADTRAMDDASYLWRVGIRRGLFTHGDLKPILDEEQSDFGAVTNTRWAQAFAYYFRNQGAIIYTSCCVLDWLGTYINTPLWVAGYGVSRPFLPPFARTYQLWQYTEHGSAPGISGDVDISRSRTSAGAAHIYLR